MERIKENKELITRYFTLSVKHHFGVNMDLNGEYTFAENLVSKKMIIAATFTEKVKSNPEIKMFLSSLIHELNNEKCSIDFVKERLDHLRESDSQEMERIV
ncbi:hypothetical protein VUJ46_01825 [Chryseobacterium sp. MYb264]|uniref:hypothetical protein n=1 Tax=Chryseobacterium sp. MYb264 TaxID=2745153 RepID=UPI002E152229|nr:hypothetical protein VUJ46_01825 [Chryseobacterium sp. MYb264]